VGAKNLSEITRTLILDEIKSELPAALSDVRTLRADAAVSTEPPQSGSFFIYEPSSAFRAPAVWTVVDNRDFRVKEKGSNHINASVEVHVNAVVEDRLKESLVIKCERYQSALFDILNEVELEDASNKVKIIIIVNRALYSPEYSPGQDTPQGMFRKECALICNVEHYEQY
jgi:hypothetical protein